MRLLLCLINVLTLITGCSSGSRQEAAEKQQSDSLKQVLARLAPIKLDFRDLYSTINSGEVRVAIDRKRDPWLFGLDENDSLQFEKADELKPVGKLFENANILSVVFVDYYDYKQALHVFNFRKPQLMPVSSFILYSTGGDAEDFWYINCEKIANCQYELTEAKGYYNDIVTMDTTYIEFRQKREIRTDTTSGYIAKTVLKTERDIIETKN